MSHTTVNPATVSDDDLYFYFISGVPGVHSEMVNRLDAMSKSVTPDLVKDWDEDLHPRDEHGKFTNSESDNVQGALNTLRDIGKFYDFHPGATFGQMYRTWRNEQFAYDQKNNAFAKAERYLAQKYQEQGMGKNNAMAQARADIGRVESLVGQSYNKQSYEEALDKYTNSKNPDYTGEDKQYGNDLRTQVEYKDDATRNIIENGNVTVAVTPEAFGRVVEDGRFKNQFETKTSNGTYDPGIRKIAESIVTGKPVDEKPADRAIYGFMTTNTDNVSSDKNASYQEQWHDMASVNSRSVEQYGEYRIVFSDSVRDRTTATIGDSLRSSRVGIEVNEPVTATASLVAGLYDRADQAYSPAYTTRYVEAQVTGGVKVSDIAEIHVPASAVESVKATLTNAGLDIPVIARKG